MRVEDEAGRSDAGRKAAAARDPALAAVVVEARPLPGVRSGSALVTFGERLLVIQDDALSAMIVDPDTCVLEALPLGAPGSAPPLPKPQKPDFEVALTLPGGRIAILGSGSAKGRCRVLEVDPDAGAFTSRDGTPLFESVARALGHAPNIEGAALVALGGAAPRVRLFHRGAAEEPSATLDVPLEALGAACVPENVVRWDLGRAGRVPFTFTDVAPCPAGRLFYLAAAEDTPNAIDDGPIIGAALGVFAPPGAAPAARFAPVTERDGSPCTRKLEGLALLSPSLAYAVTDADDPTRPAELCRLALRGPW